MSLNRKQVKITNLAGESERVTLPAAQFECERSTSHGTQ